MQPVDSTLDCLMKTLNRLINAQYPDLEAGLG
jgi:hypothetical protein